MSIYEVFKSVFRQRGESAGFQAVAVMKQGHVFDLTTNISMMASKLSLTHNIPTANSIILTTGRLHQATVWTQDADFKGLEGVEYVKKKK
ncbi:MAG: type II toxin-antitoxin system VapC family toxin [Candidatus Brocadiaceae bacterium]|nr:type II toxin-antitoxin system VapC family toxin [Candidatus Brocadiaceae bacterium]